MKPFLYQVASLFYEQYGSEISTLAFVFPNRRTGLFFQKYLSGIAQQPVFSPTILTINDLFIQLSGKQLADKISMLFILYDIYIRISGSTETFDEFLYWGEMLLNDFDDVDKYMANARMLFTNVTDLKEIEDDFSFLTSEQIAAIRTFWSSFYPKGDSPNQQEFLAVWQILYSLYEELQETLAQDNKGYEGMIFREVVERLEKDEQFRFPYTKIIFVGLNALSISEERFLSYLQRKGVADFYWDYASPFVTDKDNKASYFAERNLQQFPSLYPLVSEENEMPVIDVIGIPSGVGQAKQIYSLLSELSKGEELSSEEALKTAVVLPDETLLIPVLNSIPQNIRRINVTMGYPLAGTPVAGLMEYILAMQKNIRYINRMPAFYFRDVLPILNHRYVMSTNPQCISTLIKDIVDYNKIYISFGELNKSSLLEILFTPAESVDSFSEYLIRVLQELNKLMTSAGDDADQDDVPQHINDLEQEFIFHYFTTVNRMKEVMLEAEVDMKIETYFRLLKRMTDTITIPFHGEPLSGLQIMGVLETRALDFDRLIILSMNEGVFPLRKAANSFIPYNLRRGFGLPTYEHQDSVWAYHFYRLIHRAREVSLLYDTRSNGLHTGEVSRFVYQLKYHYGVKMNDKLVVYNVSSSKVSSITVPKTNEVMTKLSAFLVGGKRALSASALNTYLDCPLKFYFSVVEGVREEDEVTETVENNMFGSILHKVLEELYTPFKNHLVTADLLSLIKKDKKLLTTSIERAFAEVFFKTETVRPLTGQNFLIGEMIRKYIEKMLFWDSKLTPFQYIESERLIHKQFPLTNGCVVQIKGFIDRVDEVKDTIRIIDYKSGRGVSSFESVESLFDKEAKDRSKAVMQVLMYAWMYEPYAGGRTILPGIYYMRTLFSDSFESEIYLRSGRGKKEVVSDFSIYRASFEDALKISLEEIFDKETPFTQTVTESACLFCPFKGICGK